MAKAYAYHGHPALITALEPRLLEAGYQKAQDAASVNIALSYCTTQSELEDLYFGDKGLVQTMEAGSLLVDMSPITPNFARELGAVATISDLHMVEAPLVARSVVREDAFAKDNIFCLVAGEEDAIALAKPLLEVLFSGVEIVGGLGSAQLARAGITIQRVARAIASIEASALFDAARNTISGIDASHQRPRVIDKAAEDILKAVDEKRFTSSMTIEMLMAEVTAALMAADDVELILPQTEAVMHLLELLAVIGGSDHSLAALSLIYGEESESTRFGLDWSRAEQAYSSGEEYENDFGLDDYDDDSFDGDDYNSDDYQDGGQQGGFNNYGSSFGYSSN